jgi:hypothetical protein
MCVSLHPAHFSDTIVGVFEDSTGRRYMAYQNTAANLVVSKVRPYAHVTRSSEHPTPLASPLTRGEGNQWSFESAKVPEPLPDTPATLTGNAMILPIPDSVDSIEVLDTTSCPTFLKDVRDALTPRTRGGMRSFGGAKSFSVRIIDFDIYTIVIAADAAAMAEVLASKAISDERRPAINEAMIKAYTEWYPGWSIAVCCFNNSDLQEGKPLLFSYLPSKQEDPDLFFIPTLDSHDGQVPSLKAKVDVDHTIFVATNDMQPNFGQHVFYSDRAIEPAIEQRLPKRIAGRQLHGQMPNGDLVFRRSDLAAGNFRGLRALPPGATEQVERFFI